jgi:hypothetical protein
MIMVGVLVLMFLLVLGIAFAKVGQAAFGAYIDRKEVNERVKMLEALRDEEKLAELPTRKP